MANPQIPVHLSVPFRVRPADTGRIGIDGRTSLDAWLDERYWRDDFGRAYALDDPRVMQGAGQ